MSKNTPKVKISKKGKVLKPVSKKDAIQPLSAATVQAPRKPKKVQQPVAEPSARPVQGRVTAPMGHVAHAIIYTKAVPIANAKFYELLRNVVLPSDILDSCSILMLAAATPQLGETIHLNRKHLTLRDGPCYCGRHKSTNAFSTRVCTHMKKTCFCKVDADFAPHVAASFSAYKYNILQRYFSKGFAKTVSTAGPISIDGSLRILSELPESLTYVLHNTATNIKKLVVPDKTHTVRVEDYISSSREDPMELIMPSVTTLEFLHNHHFPQISPKNVLTSLTIDIRHDDHQALKQLTHLTYLNIMSSDLDLNDLPLSLETLVVATAYLSGSFDPMSTLKHLIMSSTSVTSSAVLELPQTLHTLVHPYSMWQPTKVPENLICYGHYVDFNKYATSSNNIGKIVLSDLEKLEVYLQLPHYTKISSWFSLQGGQYVPSRDYKDTFELRDTFDGMTNTIEGQLPPKLRVLGLVSNLLNRQVQTAFVEELCCTSANLSNLMFNLSMKSLQNLSIAARRDTFFSSSDSDIKLDSIRSPFGDLELKAPNLKDFQLILTYSPSFNDRFDIVDTGRCRSSIPFPLHVPNIKIKSIVVTDKTTSPISKHHGSTCEAFASVKKSPTKHDVVHYHETSAALRRIRDRQEQVEYKTDNNIAFFPGPIKKSEIKLLDTYHQVFAFVQESKHLIQPGQFIEICHKISRWNTTLEYQTENFSDWITTEHIVGVSNGVDQPFNDIVYYLPNLHTSFFRFPNGEFDMISSFDYFKQQKQ
jgi:hypothetical protein